MYYVKSLIRSVSNLYYFLSRSARESSLLNASTMDLVTVLNGDQRNPWSYIKPIIDRYAHIASLQLFTHDHHGRYKCQVKII